MFGTPKNALFPMLVTELGMVMELREEQPQNARSSMLVTELGRMMEVREEHSANAHSPMLVTEYVLFLWVTVSGIVAVARPL